MICNQGYIYSILIPPLLGGGEIKKLGNGEKNEKEEKKKGEKERKKEEKRGKKKKKREKRRKKVKKRSEEGEN